MAARLPSELSDLAETASFLRQHAATGGELIFLPHARREMAKDQVNAAQVRRALKGCAVIRNESHGLSWRATCQSRTPEGGVIEVVVEIVDPVLAGDETLGTETIEEETKAVVVTVYSRATTIQTR
jgi:predicted deacylase